MQSRRTIVLLAASTAIVLALWLIFGFGEKLEPAGPEITTGTATGAVSASTSASADETASTNLRKQVDKPVNTQRSRFVIHGHIKVDPQVPPTGARILVYAGEAGDKEQAISRMFDSMTNARKAKGSRSAFTRLDTTGRPIAEAEVTALGHFTIRALTTRHVRLILDHRYYALATTYPVHIAEGQSEINIGRLYSYVGGHLIGRVVGDVAVGTKITILTDPDPMLVIEDPKAFTSNAMRQGHQDETIKEGGQFEFRAVLPSPSVRAVLTTKEVYAISSPRAIGRGETSEILLRIKNAATMKALVLDETGEPIPEARVRVVPLESQGDFSSMNLSRSERTDSSGTCRITEIVPGRYAIRAGRTGYLPSNVEHELHGDTTDLTFTLQRGASVSGVVIDADGKPVADAGINDVTSLKVPIIGDLTSLAGTSNLALGARSSPVRSAEDGSFTLHGVPESGAFGVIADHPDFLGGIVRDVEAGAQNLVITMQRGGKVRGMVMVKGTDDPIRTFTARSKVSMLLTIERATSVTEIRDSDDGSFLLEQVPPGKFKLSIEAAGYGRFEKSFDLPEGSELNAGKLELQPAAQISGRVIDPDGLPVVDAMVMRRKGGLSDNPMVAMFFGGNSARTNERGQFTLKDLAPGRLSLKASAKDFASGQSERLRLEAGQKIQDLEIQLMRGGTVTGTLLLPPGMDPEDWKISAQLQPQGTTKIAKIRQGSTFRIENLDPGSYQIQAVDMDAMMRATHEFTKQTAISGRPDMGSMMRSIMDNMVNKRVRVRADEVTEVTLDASDFDVTGMSLVCKVNIGGSPLETGMVEVSHIDAAQGRMSISVVQDGRFELHRLQPGVLSLQIKSGMTMTPVGEPKRVEITQHQGSKEITWDLPGGGIDGHVLDNETGKPVLGALIRLHEAESTGQVDAGFAMTGTDGSFSFRGLAAGKYTVVADGFLAKDANSSGRMDNIRLGEGERRSDIELRTSPGAGIDVFVTDAVGQPLHRVMVLAVGKDGQPLGMLPFTYTDRLGRAHFAGLPSGDARIVARKRGLAPNASDLRNIQATERTEFRISLSPGTQVELTLTDKAAVPLTGASVRVRWEGGPWIPPIVLEALPLGDGRWDLGPLPAGSCEFEIVHPRASFKTTRTIPRGARASLVLSPQ